MSLCRFESKYIFSYILIMLFLPKQWKHLIIHLKKQNVNYKCKTKHTVWLFRNVKWILRIYFFSLKIMKLQCFIYFLMSFIQKRHLKWYGAWRLSDENLFKLDLLYSFYFFVFEVKGDFVMIVQLIFSFIINLWL